jgi:hypothetical protein
MRVSASACLALLPLLAWADTLVLRDGTRHEGTFISGTSRRITFVDESGRQRGFDVTQVQELAFGAGEGSSLATNRNTVAELGSAVDRLRRDLRAAMGKVTLENEDRQMLDQVSETLRAAAVDRRDGSVEYVDRREVAQALRDLQSFMDRGVLRDRDRDVIAADIDQIRQLRRATRPDNATGTRSRGYSRYR